MFMRSETVFFDACQKRVEGRRYSNVMKSTFAIWVGFVLCATAQTNLISTNSAPRKTNSTPQKQKVVVTKQMVLDGLTTISNQIAAANLSLKQIGDQESRERKRLILAVQAGQVNFDAPDDNAQKYQPTIQALRRKIAALQLQEFDIRQRYADLLK
jgi:hypothetical protein